MIKPIILVLEDNTARIKWLDYFFGQYFELIITDRVKEFLNMHKLLDDDIALIILDHDLGPSLYSGPQFDGEDIDGLNGFDAACLIETKQLVLVWSVNGQKAPIMVEKLTQRGISTIWAPHSEMNQSPLYKILTHILF